MNKDILKMVLGLTIVSTLAAISLALVYDMTKDKIAESKRQEMLKAIKTVMPKEIENEPDTDAVVLVTGKNKKGSDIKTSFYRGRKAGEIVGVAFKTSTMLGYTGLIEVMVGIDPNGSIISIEILSHAETPGLGDYITKDWFKEKYQSKSLDNSVWLVKKDGGDFDQRTGATISARAVTDAVKKGLDLFKLKKEEIFTMEAASNE